MISAGTHFWKKVVNPEPEKAIQKPNRVNEAAEKLKEA